MSWLTYLLHVNIYLSIFYLFYLALLRNETFFQYNRIYLLSTAIGALLIPIAQSEWIANLFISQEVYKVATDFNPIIILADPAASNPGNISWSLVLTAIYIAGVLIFSGIFLMRLIRLKTFISQTPVKRAFSFFNWIRLDDKLAHTTTIYQHEKVHARQLHSADNLFIELLTIINWFNPVVYAYRKTLKYMHEFIADEIAAKCEKSKADYALILLSNTMGVSNIQLTNNFFNHSLLKRRIYMLHKQRSNRMGIVKYALSAPLFIAMMTFSSATLSEVKIPDPVGTVDNLTSAPNEQKQVEQASAEVSNNVTTPEVKKLEGSQVKWSAPADTSLHQFSSIDVLPEYPGGQQKFYEYVGSEFKYPAEARKNGLSGRVTLRFIVEKDGSLSNIRIIRDAGMGTGEEAVRVLQNSVKWKPGMNKGEAVRVEYTLPIQLNLAAENNSESEKKGSLELRGPSSPIYILDGKEIDKLTLDKMDKDRIQSITVLKDQTAITKYGDKGKKGVVEITSKM